MSRLVRQLSLNHVGPTELRVVSDLGPDAGVAPGLEEAVVRRYQAAGPWPHRRVTLAVLEDFAPLARAGVADLPGVVALAERPMVTIYDPADLSSCQVMVNRAAMFRDGTWGDSRAVLGMLAHEHAHPLSECATTRASRRVQIADRRSEGEQRAEGTDMRSAVLQSAIAELEGLAVRLVVLGSREVLADEAAVRSGFGDELLHLNRGNVARAVHGLAGRDAVRGRLVGQAAAGVLPSQEAEAALLIGDMRIYLELAIEASAFERAGATEEARALDSLLGPVFPAVAPQVAPAYVALRECYIALRPHHEPAELARWAAGVLDVLSHALESAGVAWRYAAAPAE